MGMSVELRQPRTGSEGCHSTTLCSPGETTCSTSVHLPPGPKLVKRQHEAMVAKQQQPLRLLPKVWL